MFTRTANRIWVIALIVISALAALFGALASGYAFDFPVGQFVPSSPLWILAVALGGIAALGALLYPILALRKENYSTAQRKTPLADLVALLAASAALVESAHTLLKYFSLGHKFLLAVSVLAGIACVHCVMLFMRGIKKPLLLLTGACATLWAGIETLYLYFNPSFTMVSPFRTYPPLAAVALTLFLLYEAKNLKAPMKAPLLICLSGLCGTLCVTVGGATLLSYLLAWNRAGISPIDGAWLLAFGIYAFIRLTHLITPAPCGAEGLKS